MGDLDALVAHFHTDARRRGREFERVCRWFLENDPVYRRELRRVWHWDDWPGRWAADAGIDLVAEDRSGRLWAIQAKAYAPEYAITKADVDTFLAESGRSVFAFRLLIATTNRVGRTARRTIEGQEKHASLLLLGDLQRAQLDWPRSPERLRPVKRARHRPRPHQREAITAVCRGFASSDRGQLIMACGTGKTLAALFIAERLVASRTLVLVPSLSLLAQTLREWTANASSNFNFLTVCSDETVVDPDAPVANTSELGVPVTTAPVEIAAFLRGRGSKVIFATYQSSPRIAEAFKLGRTPHFDLVIADEAHRCAGRVSSDFATVLDAGAIRARRRLFMTATPRYFTSHVVRDAKQADFDIASMDDDATFGPILHRLTFGEAIDRKLLTDYQVAIVGVDDKTYRDWAARGRFVTLDGAKVTDARTLAGQIGLAKAMRKYDLRRTITFHGRVVKASRFSKEFPLVIDWMPSRNRPKGRLWCDYVSGEMASGDRDIRLSRLRQLRDLERGLLANARCLAEGVDVPALDGVAFIDPRRAEVDIVQAVGRAIRKAEGKKVGTVVLPVFLATTEDPEVALDNSAFRPIWDVLNALRAHDEILAEQLDQLRRQLGRLGKGTAPRLDLPGKINVDLPAVVSRDFVRAFDVRLVENTTAVWDFWFGLLQHRVATEGHALVPAEEVVNGYPLGQWVSAQRTARSRGALSPERVALLAELPGWSWDPKNDTWEHMFMELKRWVVRNGTTAVPRTLIVARSQRGRRPARRGSEAEDGLLLVVRRGFGVVCEGGASSSDFGDDVSGWCAPDERFRVVVPVSRPLVDDVGERGDGVEAAVAKPPVGELREPAFDKVEPRRAGRREVQVPAGPARVLEPLAHDGRVVRGEVIQHDVHVEAARDVRVDLFEERENVRGGVPLTGPVQHFTRRDVQGCEQIDGAVPLVVMGHCLGAAGFER
jgi:superfamily II DNA or RNA helicase